LHYLPLTRSERARVGPTLGKGVHSAGVESLVFGNRARDTEGMESDAQPEPAARLKPKRRWLQFSTRALLVAVTALGVALGVIESRARPQRQAVAAIEALGGFVDYRSDNDRLSSGIGVRPWPLLAPPRDWVDFPVDVQLIGTGATDAELKLLEALTKLEELSLDETEVTDSGLACLEGLTELNYLSLDETSVSDAALIHLQTLTSLKSLHLSDTQLTDAGLETIRSLSGLEVLYLDNTQVTDAGLAHLHAMARLHQISLAGTSITDVGLLHLEGLTGLQLIDLRHSRVTDAGVARLQLALPNCTIRH
jgi:hypothetical protein